MGHSLFSGTRISHFSQAVTFEKFSNIFHTASKFTFLIPALLQLHQNIFTTQDSSWVGLMELSKNYYFPFLVPEPGWFLRKVELGGEWWRLACLSSLVQIFVRHLILSWTTYSHFTRIITITFILIFSLSLPKVLERLIHSLVCSQLQIYKNICKPL